jgi:predicted amidohydrolase
VPADRSLILAWLDSSHDGAEPHRPATDWGPQVDHRFATGSPMWFWEVDGAKVLVVPAAFMMHTGRDHWEVLLRARAIENQCFVVAAGQIGDHQPNRTCFGRSMVVDPWGTVLSQAADQVGIAVADLDLDRLGTIRAELPSLANRRLPVS